MTYSNLQEPRDPGPYMRHLRTRKTLTNEDVDNPLYENRIIKSAQLKPEIDRFIEDVGINTEGGPKVIGSRYFKVIRYGDELTHTNYDEVVMKVYARQNKRTGKSSREFTFYLNRHKLPRKELLKILEFRHRLNKSQVIG